MSNLFEDLHYDAFHNYLKEESIIFSFVSFLFNENKFV